MSQPLPAQPSPAQQLQEPRRTLILVVEDEPAVQELISSCLSRAGHRVQCAADAQEAYVSIREEMPDLMLLDWMLPGMSGVDLARRLRAEPKARDLPIIMLTARSTEQDRIIGLEAGADDYITKPFSPRELMARIAAVLRRGAPFLPGGVLELGCLRLDPVAHRVIVNGSELNLGPVEFRLLHFLLGNAERAFSRAQLLEKVWGNGAQVDERTVDVHIHRLRASLRQSGCRDMIETMRGNGYRLTARR